jgi:hypothetical protein
MTKKRGITIIENLVTIVLLTIIVLATIGGFVIAKMGTARANHKTVAMDLIREYMEKEIANKYGYFGEYYTLTAAGTVRNIDGVAYTILPDPYVAGDPLLGVVCAEGVRDYKIVGFRVQWDEPVFGGAGSIQCNQRAVTYIAKHT